MKRANACRLAKAGSALRVSGLQKPADFDEFWKIVKLLGLRWLAINQPPVINGRPAVAGQVK